jgi:hypothetical protein
MLPPDVQPQVLDHEIGTHFVRKYNGKLQPKTGPKPKYSTQTRLETEEVRPCRRVCCACSR